MRALADFIMRGRVQAVVVVLLGSWVPLISPAAVALITLRRGALDGSQILLWAMLPAITGFFVGNVGNLMPFVSLGGSVAVFAAALVLRSSVSWGYGLTAIVSLSMLTVLLAALAMPDMEQQLLAVFQDVLRPLLAGAAEQEVSISKTFAAGWLAFMTTVNIMLALLLARWWQALLYNPGGFQTEFHQLRLNPAQALVTLLAMLYCLLQGSEYLAWAGVFAMPLLLGGIALVHFGVGARQLGVPVLIVFYVLLLLFSPLSFLLLVLLAFADTWVGLRAWLKPKGSQ